MLYHFLCCLVTKSCLALCELIDSSPLGSPVHAISQARILEWVAISFSKGSSGLKPVSLAWQVDSLPLSHLGSPPPPVGLSYLFFETNIKKNSTHATVVKITVCFAYCSIDECFSVSTKNVEKFVFIPPGELPSSLKGQGGGRPEPSETGFALLGAVFSLSQAHDTIIWKTTSPNRLLDFMQMIRLNFLLLFQENNFLLGVIGKQVPRITWDLSSCKPWEVACRNELKRQCLYVSSEKSV